MDITTCTYVMSTLKQKTESIKVSIIDPHEIHAYIWKTTENKFTNKNLLDDEGTKKILNQREMQKSVIALPRTTDIVGDNYTRILLFELHSFD